MFQVLMFIHSELLSHRNRNQNVVCETNGKRHGHKRKIVCCTKGKTLLVLFLMFFLSASTCLCFIYFLFFFDWRLKWKIWCCYFGRGEKEKSNDNSFAIIITTAHWKSLHSKFIVNSFSSNSSRIVQRRSSANAIISPQSICNSHTLFCTPFSLLSCSKRIFHVIWGVILCSVAY